MAERQLTGRQQAFLREYLKDFNATAAAKRAGYSARNTAIEHRLIHHPEIVRRIGEACQRIQAKLEMTADDVRQGFARIATDPRDPVHGGPTVGERILALRELGKIFGLYTNKIQVTGTFTLVDLLLAADRKITAELPAASVTH